LCPSTVLPWNVEKTEIEVGQLKNMDVKPLTFEFLSNRNAAFKGGKL
jgi:hypothetical protein